jgi:antitoxin component of MazEF toxin-antitoxin module
MKILIRRIGNSLGVIVPRPVLARWGLEAGDSLDLTPDGIRPPKRRNAQDRLDDFKRQIALEVVRSNSVDEIRRRSLENLERWGSNGVWCSAYDDWRRILESGEDGALYAAMVGQDQEANRLRQSPPYMGLLSDTVTERLREQATR